MRSENGPTKIKLTLNLTFQIQLTQADIKFKDKSYFYFWELPEKRQRITFPTSRCSKDECTDDSPCGRHFSELLNVANHKQNEGSMNWLHQDDNFVHLLWIHHGPQLQ